MAPPFALVAQGIRACASGAQGRRFESYRGHQRCQNDNVSPCKQPPSSYPVAPDLSTRAGGGFRTPTRASTDDSGVSPTPIGSVRKSAHSVREQAVDPETVSTHDLLLPRQAAVTAFAAPATPLAGCWDLASDSVQHSFMVTGRTLDQRDLRAHRYRKRAAGVMGGGQLDAIVLHSPDFWTDSVLARRQLCRAVVRSLVGMVSAVAPTQPAHEAGPLADSKPHAPRGVGLLVASSRWTETPTRRALSLPCRRPPTVSRAPSASAEASLSTTPGHPPQLRIRQGAQAPLRISLQDQAHARGQ